MKDEINKIIQSISDFYKLDNALKYYLDRHKAQILLDYITNLQTIEREYSAVLSENAELRIQISAREEEYIKLQEENKKLKELCDKYEEENSTTFEEWKKDIKANKKAIEYIEQIIDFVAEDKREIERDKYILKLLKGVDKE